MEHPVKDVPGLIKALCTGTPEQQEQAMTTHFERNAEFVHPFCWVPSFQDVKIPLLGQQFDSRTALLGIFKWYKMLSPQINISVQSAVFDQRASLLYISIRQTFSVWFVPAYRADVRLVTVLHMNPYSKGPDGSLIPTRNGNHKNDNSSADGNGDNTSNADANRGKSVQWEHSTVYKIQKQEDLYQINEWIKFILPWGIGSVLWGYWQLFSTGMCMLGVLMVFALRLAGSLIFKPQKYVTKTPNV